MSTVKPKAESPPPSPSSSSASSSSGYDSSSDSSDSSSSSGSRSALGQRAAPTSGDNAPRVPPPQQQREVRPAGPAMRVSLNESLTFTEADNALVPLPPNASSLRGGMLLRTIVTDLGRYPEGRYRFLDYFRTALEMFVNQVRKEYEEQYKSAARHGRQMTRFTWSNKGELAICFAGSCDMLKLLHDCLRPGPEKPSWDTIIGQLPAFLIAETRIPPTVLTDQTYRTKIMDWKKGGTRYQSDSSNVRFPSAEERRAKIEAYLRTGAGYAISSTVIDAQTACEHSRGGPGDRDGQGRGGHADHRHAAPEPPRAPGVVPPFVTLPPGQGPARFPMKATVKMPGALGGAVPAPPVRVGSKLGVEEIRYLDWMAKLSQIKGGSPQLEFPDDRGHMVLSLVRLCDIADLPSHFVVATSMLNKSSERIQAAFEHRGGVIVLRKFVDKLLRIKDAVSLKTLVSDLCEFKHTTWAPATKAAWLTTVDGKEGGQTPRWLLDALPDLAAATSWQALIAKFCSKFFVVGEAGAAGREKRAGERGGDVDGATDAAGGVATADAAKDPTLAPGDGGPDKKARQETYLSTVLCVKVPPSLVAPASGAAAEHDVVELINRRQAYAQERQASWEAAIRSTLARHSIDPVAIPLWYDLYALLGVDSSTLPVEDAALLHREPKTAAARERT